MLRRKNKTRQVNQLKGECSYSCAEEKRSNSRGWRGTLSFTVQRGKRKCTKNLHLAVYVAGGRRKFTLDSNPEYLPPDSV